MSEQGKDPEGAREAAEQAVRLADELAGTEESSLAARAAAYGTLGNRLRELGDREGALAATQESVTIRRTLAATRPDAFLPDLARALNNLGVDLNSLGDREGALAATQESVSIRRSLAATRPDAFLPDLAIALRTLGMVLRAAERPAEASDAFGEGVRGLLPFVQRERAAFGHLAATLLRDYLAAAEAANITPDAALVAECRAALGDDPPVA